MVKYSVLRLGIFFACLGLLWLFGLRSQDQLLLLLVLAAFISMAVSFFVLKGPRDELAERIDDRVTRIRARHAETSQDEAAEDREAESR
jgi:hypothetical protein